MAKKPHPAKEVLKRIGISQRKVAKYLCISHSYATALLNGRYKMSPSRERLIWELIEKKRTMKDERLEAIIKRHHSLSPDCRVSRDDVAYLIQKTEYFESVIMQMFERACEKGGDI